MNLHGLLRAEKAQCVIRSIEGNEDTAIERRSRTKYNKLAPSRALIQFWFTQYYLGGDRSHRGGNGRSEMIDK